MRPGQEILQKWDARAARLHPRMEITCKGLVFGAGTVLTGAETEGRGAVRVALADEVRIAALLATAFERLAGPHVLAKIARACETVERGRKS